MRSREIDVAPDQKLTTGTSGTSASTSVCGVADGVWVGAAVAAGGVTRGARPAPSVGVDRALARADGVANATGGGDERLKTP